jgi:hypothetical protein
LYFSIFGVLNRRSRGEQWPIAPEQSKSPGKCRGLWLSGLLDFLTTVISSDSSLVSPIGVNCVGQENAGAEQCHECRRELQHGNHSYTARWYDLDSINAQRFRMVSSLSENGFVAPISETLPAAPGLNRDKMVAYFRLDFIGPHGQLIMREAGFGFSRSRELCPIHARGCQCVFLETAYNRRMSSASCAISHGFSHRLMCLKRMGIRSAP